MCWFLTWVRWSTFRPLVQAGALAPQVAISSLLVLQGPQLVAVLQCLCPHCNAKVRIAMPSPVSETSCPCRCCNVCVRTAMPMSALQRPFLCLKRRARVSIAMSASALQCQCQLCNAHRLSDKHAGLRSGRIPFHRFHARWYPAQPVHRTSGIRAHSDHVATLAAFVP